MMNHEAQNFIGQAGLWPYLPLLFLIIGSISLLLIISKSLYRRYRSRPLILSEGVYCFCPSCDHDNAVAVYEYVGTADGFFHVTCSHCGLDADRTNVSLIFPLSNPARR